MELGACVFEVRTTNGKTEVYLWERTPVLTHTQKLLQLGVLKMLRSLCLGGGGHENPPEKVTLRMSLLDTKCQPPDLL